jgi:hypothetical protein
MLTFFSAAVWLMRGAGREGWNLGRRAECTGRASTGHCEVEVVGLLKGKEEGKGASDGVV